MFCFWVVRCGFWWLVCGVFGFGCCVGCVDLVGFCGGGYLDFVVWCLEVVLRLVVAFLRGFGGLVLVVCWWVWWFGFGGFGVLCVVSWGGLGFDSMCAGCSWLRWCLLLSVCYFVLVVGCGFWCFVDWLPCGLSCASLGC